MSVTFKTRRKDKQKFIQKAVTEPGSLRNYVYETFGAAGFVGNDSQKGNIKTDILAAIDSGKCPVCAGEPKVCVCPNKLTLQRVRLARTLRKLPRHRGTRK